LPTPRARAKQRRSAIEFSRCCDLYFAVVFAGGYAISFLTWPLTRHLPQKLITLFPSWENRRASRNIFWLARAEFDRDGLWRHRAAESSDQASDVGVAGANIMKLKLCVLRICFGDSP